MTPKAVFIEIEKEILGKNQNKLTKNYKSV